MTLTSGLAARIFSALDQTPRRLPFLLGGCGSGRTTLLASLLRERGTRTCQYVGVERSATTPERFYRGLISTSPFRLADSRTVRTPRDAFVAIVTYFTEARTDGGRPAMFLLDEVLDFRTFESFPGLRGVMPDLFAALAASENAFVLTTRYAHRAERLLRDPGQYWLVKVPPLTENEVRAALTAATNGGPAATSPLLQAMPAFADMAHMVHALTAGRPAYVRDVCEEMTAQAHGGGGDPISALTAILSPSGRLSARCNASYELRLQHARGYGALKAILDILAQESALTLTEIAQRLHRTPGSTKDYLSWLEDVDLVTPTRKRYAFADPVLRLWVRLHCRTMPPQDEEVAREVQRYALERLAQSTPAGTAAV